MLIEQVRETLDAYVGEEMKTVGTRGLRAVANLCKSTDTNIETFCYWWIRNRTPRHVFSNMLRSTDMHEEYSKWVDQQRREARMVIVLNLDAFNAEWRANLDDPMRLFNRRWDTVIPIVQYAMAGEFGVEAEVKWLEQRVRRQMIEQPWLIEALEGLADHLPGEEDDNATDTR